VGHLRCHLQAKIPIPMQQHELRGMRNPRGMRCIIPMPMGFSDKRMQIKIRSPIMQQHELRRLPK